MDRIQAMRLFTRIVERGTFTRAAQDLQLPRPTVTHAIQNLEASLGVRLLERTTRNVQPTRDGALYYERCIRLLADLDETEGLFKSAAPRGPLRIDMQGTLARFYIIPALPDFVRRHPDISLLISEGDRMVDLVGEGVDCVLRAGDLADSSLVGRRIATFEQVTCASPDYIKQFGVPATPDDLGEHKMVAYMASATGRPYPLEFMVDGQLTERMLASQVTVRGAEIYTASGLAGFGLIQVPRYRIEHEIAASRLQVVLARFPPPVMTFSILYPQNRQLSARVRVFSDWLTELLGVRPAQG